MKSEQQVTSLEISKRLKELGVEQESLWYYTDTRKSWKEYNQVDGKFIAFDGMCESDSELELNYTLDKAKLASHGYNEDDPISAFTVAELGEMLAGKIKTKNGGTVLSITKRGVRWYVTYEAYANAGVQAIDIEGFDDESEANARGKMLIYLLENNL